jgi:hypothetical protein
MYARFCGFEDLNSQVLGFEFWGLEIRCRILVFERTDVYSSLLKPAAALGIYLVVV